MPVLLRRLPYFTHPTTVKVHGESKHVKPYQIIVWVSLALKQETEWNPRCERFPAILDTGLTHSFSIQQRHLVEWAGMQPAALPERGHVSERGRRLTTRLASLWLHANQPGHRDHFAARPPFRLDAEDGIVVYPDDGSGYPRLPLLGLRVLTDNHLHLAVRGWRRSVTLRTRRWWWPFD